MKSFPRAATSHLHFLSFTQFSTTGMVGTCQPLDIFVSRGRRRDSTASWHAWQSLASFLTGGGSEAEGGLYLKVCGFKFYRALPVTSWPPQPGSPLTQTPTSEQLPHVIACPPIPPQVGSPCHLPLIVVQLPPDPVPARCRPPPCCFRALPLGHSCLRLARPLWVTAGFAPAALTTLATPRRHATTHQLLAYFPCCPYRSIVLMVPSPKSQVSQNARYGCR